MLKSISMCWIYILFWKWQYEKKEMWYDCWWDNYTPESKRRACKQRRSPNDRQQMSKNKPIPNNQNPYRINTTPDVIFCCLQLFIYLATDFVVQCNWCQLRNLLKVYNCMYALRGIILSLYIESWHTLLLDMSYSPWNFIFAFSMLTMTVNVL